MVGESGKFSLTCLGVVQMISVDPSMISFSGVLGPHWSPLAISTSLGDWFPEFEVESWISTEVFLLCPSSNSGATSDLRDERETA